MYLSLTLCQRLVLFLLTQKNQWLCGPLVLFLSPAAGSTRGLHTGMPGLLFPPLYCPTIGAANNEPQEKKKKNNGREVGQVNINKTERYTG